MDLCTYSGRREMNRIADRLNRAIRRVVIHYDENTGWSWLRGEDKHVTVLKTQLESKSLKDYTTRAVQRADGEWDRLEKKLEEEIERLKPGQSKPLGTATSATYGVDRGGF